MFDADRLDADPPSSRVQAADAGPRYRRAPVEPRVLVHRPWSDPRHDRGSAPDHVPPLLEGTESTKPLLRPLQGTARELVGAVIAENTIPTRRWHGLTDEMPLFAVDFRRLYVRWKAGGFRSLPDFGAAIDGDRARAAALRKALSVLLAAETPPRGLPRRLERCLPT